MSNSNQSTPTGVIEPSLEEFRALAPDRRVISVRRRLLLDTETATGLYRKLAGDRPGTFLLESAEQGVWSRYSFIGVNAVATLTETDGAATWTGRVPAGMPSGGDPLQAVAETLRRLHTPRDPALPPARSTSSSSGIPRQSAATLQPLLAATGRCASAVASASSTSSIAGAGTPAAAADAASEPPTTTPVTPRSRWNGR